jgi:cytochrome c
MAAVRSLAVALAAAASAFATAAPGAPPDLRAGQAVYERCMACHALAWDRTGPHHCGLFGRRAGSVPGFPYSEAMKKSEIVWSARTLDRFLADPAKTVPGTTMGYAGVKDPGERAALIAWLRASTRCAEPGKQK